MSISMRQHLVVQNSFFNKYRTKQPTTKSARQTQVGMTFPQNVLYDSWGGGDKGCLVFTPRILQTFRGKYPPKENKI